MSAAGYRRSHSEAVAPEVCRLGDTNSGCEWRASFARLHWRFVAGLLVGLLTWHAMGAVPKSGSEGGALLLLGGALVGLPHGSSDFLVAHRLFKPRYGRWWLPIFVSAYLVVITGVLLGWRFEPGVTFLVFLAMSALHFSTGDDPQKSTGTGLFFARAATPIVPIFLCHPGDVSGIVGLMSGRSAASIAMTLNQLRPLGLALYLAFLAWVVPSEWMGSGIDVKMSAGSRDVIELALLALGACLLPPLLCFTIYFCLIHAVRHMVQLGHDRFPRNGAAALRLAVVIVAPSAVICSLALGLAWNAVAGVLTTEHLLAIALQATAALTVPHVLLEWWAAPRPETA